MWMKRTCEMYIMQQLWFFSIFMQTELLIYKGFLSCYSGTVPEVQFMSISKYSSYTLHVVLNI